MAKREPHWVKLFLRELERTGNVRISAERAGVDYTSAYQRRKRHGEFAERWEASLGVFRDGSQHESALDGAPSTIPSSGNGPPPRTGEELVVRPDGKLIKGSEARWGKRAETRFLTELTVSGSVRLAARAAGFSTVALYKRRAKDGHFAAAWEAALDAGKARVQSYLVEAATRTFDPDELPIGDEREIPKVSIGEAINIAKMPARPSTALGTNGTAAGSGRSGWLNQEGGLWVSDEEFKEARERVIARLERLRERDEEKQRETGRCNKCGQPLPVGAEAASAGAGQA